MDVSFNNLPDDVASLKVIVSTYQQRVDILTEEKKQQDQRINFLEEELRLLKDRMFNKKSEKVTEDELLQGRLFDEVEVNSKPEDVPTVEVKSYRRKKGGKKKLPESLPRVEIKHDIPEEEKQCECGHMKERIGTVESERLDIIPAKIRVEKHIRYKYACKQCEGVESSKGAVQTAPLPPQLIPQGMATPGLVAYITAGKYIDGTPLYRLEKIFTRFGVDLSRQTMCNWLMTTYEKTKSLMELMWDDLLSYPLIGIDETRVQVLKEPGRKNTSLSYMWVFRGEGRSSPLLLFRYQPTRSPVYVEKLLKDYRGTIQTDGYVGYDKIGRYESIVHAGCWAHARRKFIEAEKAGGSNEYITEVLKLIRNLYAVEKHIRENNLDNNDIFKLRNEKSRPVIDYLHKLLMNKHGTVPPKNKLGEAISYTLDDWDKLIVYLDNSLVPIDNNPVENAIRPFVIGRKNWLFSGSPRGANASAAFYSLIETAKANDIEPYWYLRYLFTKLPYCECEEDLRKLLPYQVTTEIIRKVFAKDML